MNYLFIETLLVAISWHVYPSTEMLFHLPLVDLIKLIPVFALFFATGWIVDTVARKKTLASGTLFSISTLSALAMAIQL